MNILEIYHKLVLAVLIGRSVGQLKDKKLPGDIKKLYDKNFQRIINSIESTGGSPGFYLYSQDDFCKDLAICSLRMIPVGHLKIHLSGIPRRFLFKNGWKNFFGGVSTIFFELGGSKPLYEMHIDLHDPDAMAEFNLSGRIRSFGRIAEILKMNEEVRGVFASSWFYDPQLEKISPRLNHVRELMTENGGKLFYMGSSAQDIKKATLKSSTRRKLYLEGRYLPANYMAIWSRKKLINWADKAGLNYPGRQIGG